VRHGACPTTHTILTKKLYFLPLGTTLTNFLRIYKHSPTIKNKQPTAATIRFHNLEPDIIKNITNYYMKLSPKIDICSIGKTDMDTGYKRL